MTGAIDDDDFLNRCKWVRIMCDTLCFGVWDRKGRSCDVDCLPVTQDLRDRLLEWQDHYNLLDDAVFEGETVDWREFSTEGLQVARDVKEALPDWTVIYHDEHEAMQTRGTRDRPRDKYEYEVTK